MAKTKEADKNIEEIKKNIEQKKAVLGTAVTLKNLRRGTLAKIFVSVNVPDSVRKDIDYYAKLNKVKVVSLNYPNDELGTMCKKPFFISVIGLMKA